MSDNTVNWNQMIPIILSSAVSLAAVLIGAYQSRMNARVKLGELYFRAQLEAYQRLLCEVISLDVDLNKGNTKDFRCMITASQNAQLVSTAKNAEIISHFCTVYRDFVDESDAGTLSQARTDEFCTAKDRLICALQQELMRFDKSKRKLHK